jgi:hypothetical protein
MSAAPNMRALGASGVAAAGPTVNAMRLPSLLLTQRTPSPMSAGPQNRLPLGSVKLNGVAPVAASRTMAVSPAYTEVPSSVALDLCSAFPRRAVPGMPTFVVPYEFEDQLPAQPLA